MVVVLDALVVALRVASATSRTVCAPNGASTRVESSRQVPSAGDTPIVSTPTTPPTHASLELHKR